jgi:alanyl-tRNA synthetase
MGSIAKGIRRVSAVTGAAAKAAIRHGHRMQERVQALQQRVSAQSGSDIKIVESEMAAIRLVGYQFLDVDLPVFIYF